MLRDPPSAPPPSGWERESESGRKREGRREERRKRRKKGRQTLEAMAPLFLAAVMAVTLASPSPPSPAKLGCWFVEEAAGGPGSMMPSNLRQRPALLLLPTPGTRVDEADLESELPPEVEAGLAFQILDPSGTMWGSKSGSSRPLWLEEDPDHPEAASAVACEVNAYIPQESHVPWAAGLEEGRGCPRSLEGGKWFIATVQSPEVSYGVSAILHQEMPAPLKERSVATRTGSVVTTASAVLSVFTRTPRLRSRLGQDVVIDCGFSGPSSRFSVEWRHQHGGSGRVVLAYDGASGRVSVAEEGARLFLDPQEDGGNNVSLQLQGVGVRHEGTYICTVYLPHLHAQQAAELRVLEPPKVALRPDPLSVAPSAKAELACGISGYYPQSVSVVWKRRGPAGDEELTGSWESGHHQAPDGTFTFTSYVRLPPVRPQDHGATFSCSVAHPALGETPLRKAMTLHIKGSAGPSVEDTVGLFLIAFALFGFLQAFSRRVFGEKTKSQKVD